MYSKKEARNKILWVLDALNSVRQLQEYGLICVINIDFSELPSNSPTIENIRDILRTQLERKLGVLEIVETYSDDWSSTTKFLLEIDRDKFDREYRYYKSNNVFEYGLLRINSDGGTVQYGDEEAVELSPDNRYMRFLVTLLKKHGNTVSYSDLATELNLNSESEDKIDKDYAREIQFIKRDTKNFLISKVKMPKKEIKIVAVKNMGFRIDY